MKIPAAVLLTLVALAAACGPPPFERPWPVAPPVPPDPPERLLRQPVDYTFRDHLERKNFLLRLYEDPDFGTGASRFKETVITVVDWDNSDENERLATLAEYDHAWKVFQEDWVNRSREEKFAHFRKIQVAEEQRDATLLEKMIQDKETAIEQLETEKFDGVDARLRANADAGHGTPEGQAHLQRRSDEMALQLLILEAERDILKYKLELYNEAHCGPGTR